MKHKIQFCHSSKKPISECYGCNDYLLDKKDMVISCKKCKGDQGLWYYNGYNKIWIPNCNCPNLIDKLGIPNKDLCQNIEYKLKKQHIYGKDIDSNIQHLCLIDKYLDDKDVKCYYNCEGIIPNFDRDDIGCNLPNGEILKIPGIYLNGRCLNKTIDIRDKLVENDKLEDCTYDNYKCSKFFNTIVPPKSHAYIKDVPPNCFYKIPVEHGKNLTETKNVDTTIGPIELHGYSCLPCNLIDNLIQVDNLIYLFHGEDVFIYRYDDHNKIVIKENEPIKAGVIFPNIPLNSSILYWKKYNSLFCFKDNLFYKYCLDKEEIIVSGKITQFWKDIPSNIDNVFLLKGDPVFVTNNTYYIIESYSYIPVYKNYFLVYLPNYNSVNTYIDADEIVKSINAEMITKNKLINLRKRIKVFSLKGWIMNNSDSIYSINTNNNYKHQVVEHSIDKYSKFSDNPNGKIGIWCQVKSKKHIPGGRIKSCDSIGKLIKHAEKDSGIRFEKIFNLNDYKEFWGLSGNYISIYSKNWRLINTLSIEDVFKNLSTPKKSNINLCDLKKTHLKKFKYLGEIRDDRNKTKYTLTNQKKKTNKTLDYHKNDINKKKEVVKMLNSELKTKSRVIQQQNSSYNQVSLKIFYFYILLVLICFLILYIFIKYYGN